MPDHRTHVADSPCHRTLPIGERLSGAPLVDDWLSCFDDVTLKVLEPMLVPEEPRAGELDRAECGHCKTSDHTIWADDLWHVNAGWSRMGIPYVGGLAPNRHCTPRHRVPGRPRHARSAHAADQRRGEVDPGRGPDALRAVGRRQRAQRWPESHVGAGEAGGAAGMMQGRGAMLAFWDDVLPAMPDELKAEHLRIVAESLASGGGTAFPNRAQAGQDSG